MEGKTLPVVQPGPADGLVAESSSQSQKASEGQVNPEAFPKPRCDTEVENHTGSQKAPQSSEATTPKLAPLPTTSRFKFDSIGRLCDPDLTDDTVIFEAPSFIVPFLYEKPPKETFHSFKESVKKLSQTNAEKEENNNKESAESSDEDEESSEEEDEQDESDEYFSSGLGKFVAYLGMNLVDEHVQEFLLKNKTRQYDKDQDPKTLQNINSIKKNLGTIRQINSKFHLNYRKCHLCRFKTESQLVLQNHLETLHVKDGLALCSFCSLTSLEQSEIFTHMVFVHGAKAKLEPQSAAYECSHCNFGHKWKQNLVKHQSVCEKNFKIERNQETPADWTPPAKTLRSRTADYALKNRPFMNQIMNFYNHCSTSNTPPFPYVGQAQTSKSVLQVSGYLKNLQPVALNQLKPGGSGLKSDQQPYLPRNVAIRMPLRPDAAPFLGPSNYFPLPMHNSLLPKQPPFQGYVPPNASLVPRIGATSVETTRMRITHTIGTSLSETACEICDFDPNIFDLLKDHMLMSHRVDIKHLMPGSLKCTFCTRGFYLDEGLRRHLLGEHSLISSELKRLADNNLDAGKCPHCPGVFRCKLVEHVQTVHKRLLTQMGALFTCHKCHLNFNSHHLLNAHFLFTHGCSASIPSANSLQPANNGSIRRPVFSRSSVETPRTNQFEQKRTPTPCQTEVIEISDGGSGVSTPEPDTPKSSPEVVEISDDEG